MTKNFTLLELHQAKDKAAENLEVQKVMWMKDMDGILQAKAKEGAVNMSAAALMRSKNSGPPPLVAEESTMNKINSHMTELDVKVVHLKEIFRHGDPMVERKKAVTKINACVRGWPCRLNATRNVSGRIYNDQRLCAACPVV